MERLRTSRRYLRACGYPRPIDTVELVEIVEKDNSAESTALNWLEQGNNVGLMSESGMPGVADPGSKVVKMAHKAGIQVMPLVGPSSIFMALAASGLNGQNFQFHGYLPIKENDLRKKLKQLESESIKYNKTQIFIETPYRNNRMLSFCKNVLDKASTLGVALDITGSNEKIIVKTLQDWKKYPNELEKLPAIFMIGK
ncbi:MAG: SAM-dependent methyltransferase [Saprospiraceae bacterium]|nr:SAM-dependent methyltransferase [Saprospiraceae bacterium]